MHRVGLVVVGDFQIMSCAAVAAFDVANIFAGNPLYKVRVISERGGIARSSIGLAIETSMAATSDRIQTVLSYARQHLRSELSVEELAAAAHLSVRQFTRAFRQETGQSPAKAVEALRVEVARVMLEEGSRSVEEVADETGFGERERMRRSFVRAFGRPPQAVRRNLREVRPLVKAR
jgi:transcriptional regulator GlxA family with amidase domain